MRPYHTPLRECTSNCRRVGCPEEDVCAYCGTNKWVDREKHIGELAKFLQGKIAECQEVIADLANQ